MVANPDAHDHSPTGSAGSEKKEVNAKYFHRACIMPAILGPLRLSYCLMACLVPFRLSHRQKAQEDLKLWFRLDCSGHWHNLHTCNLFVGHFPPISLSWISTTTYHKEEFVHLSFRCNRRIHGPGMLEEAEYGETPPVSQPPADIGLDSFPCETVNRPALRLSPRP